MNAVLALAPVPDAPGAPPVSVFLYGVVAAVLFLAGCVAIIALRYKRCPPDRALVIFGKTSRQPDGGRPRILAGGGAFVWPLIQGYAWLDLGPRTVDSTVAGVVTADRDVVDLCCATTVEVAPTAEGRQQAAARILGLSPDALRGQVDALVEGVLRRVVQGLSDEQPLDLDLVRAALQPALEQELSQLGLAVLGVALRRAG